MVEPGTNSDKHWVQILDVGEAQPYLPRLQAVLERHPELWAPLLTITDVIDLIRDEIYQLWIGGDGDIVEMFALTEVACAPRAKIITVVWCGGWNVTSYIEKFFTGIDLFAEMIEADYVYVNGRAAWGKLLRPLGYEFAQISLIKEVRSAKETALNRDADDAAGALPGTERPDELGDGVDQADGGEPSDPA
jgi:hypothetical protein